MDDKYIPTVWEKGELITALRLNKVEEATESLYTNVSGLNDLVGIVETIANEQKTALEQLAVKVTSQQNEINELTVTIGTLQPQINTIELNLATLTNNINNKTWFNGKLDRIPPMSSLDPMASTTEEIAIWNNELANELRTKKYMD